jgi:hypothetical protein
MPVYVLWCRDCGEEREARTRAADLDKIRHDSRVGLVEKRYFGPGCRCKCGSRDFRIKPSSFTFSVR